MTEIKKVCNFIFLIVLYLIWNVNNQGVKTSVGSPMKTAESVSVDENSRSGTAGKCGSKFLPAALDEKIAKKCTELIGLRLENFPPKKEDLIKINYDDMCFSKCYLTELNYLTAADYFDKTGIMAQIKKDAPQDKWPALLRSTNKCILSTEEAAKVEGGITEQKSVLQWGGISNSICKYALIFFVCQRDEERKMVC